jgi:molybdate transport system ATP-binding protein
MTSLIKAQLQLDRAGFKLNVELDIPGRGITVIFGPSGAGKTTLLRAIAGLEKCTGTISVAGDVWQDKTLFLPPHKRALGYVFQEASLFDHLSVRGNLEYGYKRVPVDGRKIEFDQAIELLGLASLLNRRSNQLSGGERKRVAIARALLSNPKLLLMDEPLASLDLQHKHELMPFLEKLRDQLNIPIIYISHSPDEVARLADHLILMEQGRSLAAGPVNEILTRFDLPIAHDFDAGAVIKTQPGIYDAQFDLTPLEFAGGSLLVPGNIQPTDSLVRVRIMARDVSLTLEHQSDTSILNIVTAKVVEITADGPAQTLIKLDAKGATLLARITRKSASTLQLSPGKTVYAQIKTVALLST